MFPKHTGSIIQPYTKPTKRAFPQAHHINQDQQKTAFPQTHHITELAHSSTCKTLFRFSLNKDSDNTHKLLCNTNHITQDQQFTTFPKRYPSCRTCAPKPTKNIPYGIVSIIIKTYQKVWNQRSHIK